MRDQRANRASGDGIAAQIAARQHGVLSMPQLNAAGLDKHWVSRRLRAGRLHRVHRGVYAVGHPTLSLEGRWMATVLAMGEGAVISHLDAAVLLKFLNRKKFHMVEVTVPGMTGRRRRKGIQVHRSVSLTAADTTRRNGIPVTTPRRTIADLRGSAPPRLVRHVIRQAEMNGFRIEADPVLTRSELEDRFLSICGRYRLPKPEVNVLVDGIEVDFLWRDERLVVEIDSYRYHGTRSNFDSDRARDVRLKLLGYDVARFTDRQLEETAAAVGTAMRNLLRGSLDQPIRRARV